MAAPSTSKTRKFTQMQSADMALREYWGQIDQTSYYPQREIGNVLSLIEKKQRITMNLPSRIEGFPFPDYVSSTDAQYKRKFMVYIFRYCYRKGLSPSDHFIKTVIMPRCQNKTESSNDPSTKGGCAGATQSCDSVAVNDQVMADKCVHPECFQTKEALRKENDILRMKLARYQSKYGDLESEEKESNENLSNSVSMKNSNKNAVDLYRRMTQRNGRQSYHRQAKAWPGDGEPHKDKVRLYKLELLYDGYIREIEVSFTNNFIPSNQVIPSAINSLCLRYGDSLRPNILKFHWTPSTQTIKDCDKLHALYVLQMGMEKVRKRINYKNESFRANGRTHLYIDHPNYIQIITDCIELYNNDTKNDVIDGEFLNEAGKEEIAERISDIGNVEEGVAMMIAMKVKKVKIEPGWIGTNQPELELATYGWTKLNKGDND